MTNEEKARELSDSRYCVGLTCEQCRDIVAIKMAQWKDEQFAAEKQALIDKACDLYRSDLQQFQNLIGKIRKNAKGMIDIDGSLSDFRKAMEE